VTGTPSSRTAQELAFSLSRNLGTDVVLLHVVNRPESAVLDGARGRQTSRRGVQVDTGPTGTAAAVLDEAEALARRFDVDARSLSRVGTSTGEEIVAAAAAADADLIVLGATVRRLRGRPFLGHTVEHVLDNAPTTVVVVAVPSTVPETEPVAS
jgi:nucleotide-binding universal stress UspA family protein